MLAFAMLAGALAAGAVAACRLPGTDGLALLPGLLDWTLRAWVYAFAWLGMFCGISHFVKSGGKAMALSILAMMAAAVWPTVLGNLVSLAGCPPEIEHLDALVPSAAHGLMWRRAPAALVQGVTHLAALALFYLSLGAAVFRHRDV